MVMNVHHNKIRKTALPRTGRALDAIGGGSITSYRIESGEGGGGLRLLRFKKGRVYLLPRMIIYMRYLIRTRLPQIQLSKKRKKP